MDGVLSCSVTEDDVLLFDAPVDTAEVPYCTRKADIENVTIKNGILEHAFLYII